MRRLKSLARAGVAVAAATAVVGAQAPSERATTPGTTGGGAVQMTQPRPGQAVPSGIRTEIAILRATGLFGHIPPADSFVVGTRDVSAGETVGGPIAVARGSANIFGRVEGDVIVLHGDIVAHEGSLITGDAITIGGHVRARGGVIEGDIRPMAGFVPMAGATDRRARSGGDATWHGIKVVLGWFAILAVIGIGVLLFAEPSFTPVVDSMHQRFGRAFLYGIVAQLAAIPLLVVILIALALTIVGILLIPFAIVAYAVALAGVLTLGFLAVARFTGGAIVGDRAAVGAPPATRRSHLRALVIGLVLYLGLWLVAAAFSWSPLVGSILRAAAVAVTWVAVTLGLGAIIASRLALWRPQAEESATGGDPMVWQTPTPVTGVAAARRPAAVRTQAS